MNKLIELFRDYVENYWNDTKDPTIDIGVIYDWQWFYVGARFYSDEKVLSKKFWFIKWLVQNDKIEWSEKTAFVTFLERELNADKSDALVSLLAVKDIEFLISILK